MAKSNAQRQREYKERQGDNFKRLDVLLPINTSKLLQGNAKMLGLSKADYIVKLLHDNETIVDCAQVILYEPSKNRYLIMKKSLLIQCYTVTMIMMEQPHYNL